MFHLKGIISAKKSTVVLSRIWYSTDKSFFSTDDAVSVKYKRCNFKSNRLALLRFLSPNLMLAFKLLSPRVLEAFRVDAFLLPEFKVELHCAVFLKSVTFLKSLIILAGLRRSM